MIFSYSQGTKYIYIYFFFFLGGGGAKISNIFGGMPDFPDIYFVDAASKPT